MAITPDTVTTLPKKIADGIIAFSSECCSLSTTNWNIRDSLRTVDLLYQRELDQSLEQSRAKRSNRYGDQDKYQNITVPVVMPAVEAAVTYQASVFLTGNPLFAVVAPPKDVDAGIQLESIIDSQAIKGGWAEQFALHFRNAFKYNIAALEVSWEKIRVPSFELDADNLQTKVKDLYWSGNNIKNLSMYNTFFDSRVSPLHVPTQGEFAGYTEMMSRIRLKTFISSMPNTTTHNIKEAFNSESGNSIYAADSGRFFVPEINPNSLIDKSSRMQSTNWLAWAGITGADKNSNIQYKNSYEVTTLYGRIIPSDFGLRVPSANTPQVWKFIIVNGQVVIHAERMTNAHNMIPILFSQPLRDDLDYQTKSLAQNVAPIQAVTSAMLNSVIAARRRAISDRGIYNPLYIAEADINAESPSAKIPLRAAAYNKSASDAYYAIPFRDDQSQVIMQQLPYFNQMANLITGQNPVRQGQFVKGNKTQSEFSDVMSNANGRDQLAAIMFETQLFTPLKEILKVNILQYQGAESVYSRSLQEEVTVDPMALRNAMLNFKIADGLLPVDKIMDGDSWQVALQTAFSSPQIGASYNIGPMFSYMMKSRGAHIGDFEKSKEQVAYESAANQWAAMAQASIDKGIQFAVPQPLPEQFGYNPSGAENAQPTT